MRDNIFTVTLKEEHPIQYYLARSFGWLIVIILSPIVLPLSLYFAYRVNKSIKEAQATLEKEVNSFGPESKPLHDNWDIPF